MPRIYSSSLSNSFVFSLYLSVNIFLPASPLWWSLRPSDLPFVVSHLISFPQEANFLLWFCSELCLVASLLLISCQFFSYIDAVDYGTFFFRMAQLHLLYPITTPKQTFSQPPHLDGGFTQIWCRKRFNIGY